MTTASPVDLSPAPPCGRSPNSDSLLVRCADEALYDAKRAGRNRVVARE